MLKKEKIKQDLLDQLERDGVYGDYYLDLINDYISLWEIKNKLIEDGKKNPYTEWRNSETSFGRKKNDSIDQALKVSQQMIKILDFLNIKPSKQDGELDDNDMEM
ncbi:MAG: RNA polymerase subunit sigma-70 [Gottschalkiaceae bacterium]|nr:MAG: RNA polymerase subunit sigma-70 [Gottschalkiaceae bacterium]